MLVLHLLRQVQLDSVIRESVHGIAGTIHMLFTTLLLPPRQAPNQLYICLCITMMWLGEKWDWPCLVLLRFSAYFSFVCRKAAAVLHCTGDPSACCAICQVTIRKASNILGLPDCGINAALCCAVLCCAVLCCAVLCCAVLCCDAGRHALSPVSLYC